MAVVSAVAAMVSVVVAASMVAVLVAASMAAVLAAAICWRVGAWPWAALAMVGGRGGWGRGGWGRGGFGRGGWGWGGGWWPAYAGLGLGYGLDAWGYGYPYDYGYGYPDYAYGYGYPDYAYGYGYPGYDYSYASPPAYSTAPLVTGRSVATGHMGRMCSTPVKACELYHSSYVGNGCSCRVAGGRSRGTVSP